MKTALENIINLKILASIHHCLHKTDVPNIRRQFFGDKFLMKNDEKMSHPKLIQNHFGNVPVAPGHKKTSFWIELSFRRPPTKFIKIII